MTRKVLLKDLPLTVQQMTLGSGPNTRQEELEARFREFHVKHPEVFRFFMHYAEQMGRYYNHYSAYGIMHMVRYKAAGMFGARTKIGNNLIPYYARLAIKTDPRLEGFFTTRRLTTEDKRPRNFGGEA